MHIIKLIEHKDGRTVECPFPSTRALRGYLQRHRGGTFSIGNTTLQDDGVTDWDVLQGDFIDKVIATHPVQLGVIELGTQDSDIEFFGSYAEAFQWMIDLLEDMRLKYWFEFDVDGVRVALLFSWFEYQVIKLDETDENQPPGWSTVLTFPPTQWESAVQTFFLHAFIPQDIHDDTVSLHQPHTEEWTDVRGNVKLYQVDHFTETQLWRSIPREKLAGWLNTHHGSGTVSWYARRPQNGELYCLRHRLFNEPNAGNLVVAEIEKEDSCTTDVTENVMLEIPKGPGAFKRAAATFAAQFV